MSKLKKVLGNMLAGLMVVVSFGTLAGCSVVDQTIANNFDEEINVYRDGIDVYIYNGVRYIHTSVMDNYKVYRTSQTVGEDTPIIGYAYGIYGLKEPVYVLNTDETYDVIFFATFFNNRFYVKESVQILEPLEMEFVLSDVFSDALSDGFSTPFLLKGVVTEKVSFYRLQQTKPLENIGWEDFYFLPGRALLMSFDIYMDETGNVYINESSALKCYKVTEEFKERLISRIEERKAKAEEWQGKKPADKTEEGNSVVE